MQPNDDFRRWLAFNESLTRTHRVANLYKAVSESKCIAGITCERRSGTPGEEYCVISDGTGYPSLILTQEQKKTFLNYLREHYLPQANIPTAYSANIKSAAKDNHLINTRPVTKSTSRISLKYFLHKNIRRHVLGYAIVGILVSQFLIIPTNVFHVKSNDFISWTFVLFFGTLSHFAVRNYKKNFLRSGIRYAIVWKIVFWLSAIIFLILSLEVSFIDAITKDSYEWLPFIGVTIIMVLAGLLSGWILSILIYFLNGGKVITDPNSVTWTDKDETSRKM